MEEELNVHSVNESDKQKEEVKPKWCPNPHGRPKGSRNVSSWDSVQMIRKFCSENMGKFLEDYEKLKAKPEIRARLYIDMCKMITPRVISEDEKQMNNSTADTLERLFKHKQEE